MFYRNSAERILQFIAVYHHTFLWLVLPMISVWLPIYILFFTRFWWAICLYALWFFYDFETPSRGSRNWNWYRNSSIWQHFSNYFPIKLEKTAELPADKNYIMGCHPHGVFSIGAFTHLCTSATGFAEKFPGLKANLLTLNGQFWFPFRREIGIGLGGVECSSKSLRFLLRNKEGGALAGIVVGGAEEVLDAHPGRHHLKILDRFGFCRIALETGSSLVPSFSFGEIDVYEQYPHPHPLGSTLRTIQSNIKKKLGFCPPIILGCSIFSSRFGLLPRRKPITTVVGAPIPVERVDGGNKKPSEEQVRALHQKYCDALSALFEEHKQRHGIGRDERLHFY